MPDMDKGCQQLSEITDIQVNDIGDTDSTKGVVEWKKKEEKYAWGRWDSTPSVNYKTSAVIFHFHFTDSTLGWHFSKFEKSGRQYFL